MLIRRFVLGAALAVGVAGAAFAQAGPVVKIKQGGLRGAEAGGVAVFSGIPFAAPPVGDLRWKSPAAAPTWTGERDATAGGADCTKTEDCLFLNVTKPAAAKVGAKLPVMVWIHGGAFVAGASERGFGAEHDGTEFAKKGIVTVSVNYRLGRAGWFAHPAITKEGGPTGNYGLMDQIAALKWVQANIASFGGDPKNVTIFGESAGGISVLYLMTNPETKGLYQKAIVESGFPRHTPTTLAAAEEAGVKAATAAGVTGDDAAAAAALRKVPLSSMPYTGSFTQRASPILDGKLIAQGITQGFAAGKQAKIPLMLGGNSDEASLFRPQAAQLDAIPADRREALAGAFASGDDKVRLIRQITTAQFMTEPDRNLARIHSKAGQPAYLYYFSYVNPARRTGSYGAGHVDEIRYVFGGEKQKFTAEDRPVSTAMNAAWAQFAKTGDPGAAAGVKWPRFAAGNEATLEFGETVSVLKDHQAKALDLIEAGQP